MSSFKNLIHYRTNSYQPQDFEKPQKRVNYKFPSSNRVLNPNLLEEKKELKRNLSDFSKLNNGNWNRMLNRTSKEESLTGQRCQYNPKVLTSTVLNNQPTTKLRSLRHNKSTVFTNYSNTTQICALPGGVKRESNLIKDDKKDYSNKMNFASIMKRNREFGPVVIEKDPVGMNRSLYMGNYGYRDKQKETGNFYMNSKVNEGVVSEYSQRGKRREPPYGKNLFRSQIVIS